MNKKILCTFALGVVLSACAPSTRGTVLMKLNNDTVHISNGQNDTAVGQSVSFLRSDCGNSRALQCPLKTIGHGTISKKLSKKYSEVALGSGSQVKEGDLVEAQP